MIRLGGLTRQLYLNVTKRHGPIRVKQLYAFRSILDGGSRITLGTDFPVEDMNPFKTFYAAVTRTTPDGMSPHGEEGWYAGCFCSRPSVVRGFVHVAQPLQ